MRTLMLKNELIIIPYTLEFCYELNKLERVFEIWKLVIIRQLIYSILLYL